MNTKIQLTIIFLIIIVCIILVYSFFFQEKNKKIVSMNENVTFHYQLQNATYSDLQKISATYFVVDIDDVHLTKDQINSLHVSGKKVLSYVSIGEAENYRDYWQKNWKKGSPTFVDDENPEWKGNYKVHYWESEWQNIIFERIKKIQDAGYDGVYLDIIDAYEYYKDQGREQADAEMMLFVVNISLKTKQKDLNFLIIPQNSPELYKNHSYKNSIDGLGKEDLWYNDDTPRTEEEIQDDLQYLRQAVFDKKFVLSIDYPTKQKNICDYYQKCKEQGFFCMVSNRHLDKNIAESCNE